MITFVKKTCARLLDFICLPDDTLWARATKRMMLLTYSGLIVFALVFTIFDGKRMMVIITASEMTVSAILLARLLFTKKLTQETVTGFVLFNTGLVMLADLYKTSTGTFAWPLFLLIIDACLMLRLPTKLIHFQIYCFIIWTSFLFFVQGFDLFSLMASLRDIDDDPTVFCLSDYCTSCGNPPCASIRQGFERTSFALAVYWLDYQMTLSFTIEIRKRQDETEKSIEIAEGIATALAGFDLPVADSLLDLQGHAIEPALRIALVRLLDNLREYRPYLPDALFETSESPRSLVPPRMTPPGEGTNIATIVFTDIQSSTVIWQCCAGMRDALKTHNNIIRQVSSLYNGYEVKTIGDSFMMAFDTSIDGINFAMGVQSGLYSATWPTDLDLVPASRSVPQMYCGLRVRIGIHTGQVQLESNKLTGRVDYFGTTVNMAARIEGCATGGSTAVTVASVENVHSLGGFESLSCKVYQTYETGIELRGFTECSSVYFLYPEQFSNRHHDRPAESDDELASIISLEVLHRRRSSDSQNTSASVRSAQINLQMKLSTSSSSTVAIVLLGSDVLRHTNTADHNRINDLVAMLIDNAERCEAVITSLTSAALTSVWNASKKCVTHVQYAMKFVGMTRKSVDSFFLRCPNEVGVALATGPLLHGHVGTHRQRFIAAMGPCADLCNLIVNLITKLRIFALIASTPAAPEPYTDDSLSGLVRPVSEIDAFDTTIVVHQLRSELLKEYLMTGLRAADYPWESDIGKPSKEIEVKDARGDNF